MITNDPNKKPDRSDVPVVMHVPGLPKNVILFPGVSLPPVPNDAPIPAQSGPELAATTDKGTRWLKLARLPLVIPRSEELSINERVVFSQQRYNFTVGAGSAVLGSAATVGLLVFSFSDYIGLVPASAFPPMAVLTGAVGITMIIKGLRLALRAVSERKAYIEMIKARRLQDS